MLHFSITMLVQAFLFRHFNNKHANFEEFIAGREEITRVFVQHYFVT